MAEAVKPVERPRPAAARSAMISGCLAVLFAITLVQAADPPGRKTEHSTQRRLGLFAKEPTTWRIIDGGAHGTLTYDGVSGVFTFTASRLRPNTGYLLVRHTGGAVSGDLLADGASSRNGEIRLSGTWCEWNGKIWLVPTADVSLSGRRGTLTAWHPEQILFEERVLGIPCECDH